MGIDSKNEGGKLVFPVQSTVLCALFRVATNCRALNVRRYANVPEQQRIADCLSSLDARITAETQKLEALKTHKQGLMQQLFPTPEEAEA